ncbi:MAG TPA: ABC transporter permease [Vicinamibacterales bacterium]|nr:ABC transporter permease [Vicinamibacterales bacterium]
MRRLAQIPLAATLAIAVAFNVVSASVLTALLQRPFPYPELSRLVLVRDSRPASGAHEGHAIAAADFFDLRSSVRAFSALTAYRGAPLVISNHGSDPQRIEGIAVTANFFSTLGVTPILGRAWSDDADAPGHDRVMLVSHRFWRARFGGDASAIGRELTVNGRQVLVLGVVRDEECYPAGVDAWVPLVMTPTDRLERSAQRLAAIARLTPGDTIGSAGAQLESTAARLRALYPATNAGRGFDLLPLRREQYEFTAPLFTFAAAAALLVLALGIVNVATVLTARHVDRAPDFAIRSMLGATRAHLGRLILGETAAMTISATAVGVIAAWPALNVLRASLPEGIARWINGWSTMRVDGEAVAVGLGVGVLMTVVIAGTLAATARRSIDAARSGARLVHGMGAGRRLIVGSQIALASSLLLCALAVVRAMDRQFAAFAAFAPDRVLRFTLTLPPSRYDTDAKVGAFHARMLETIDAVTGVEAAALVRNEPASNVPSPLVDFDRVDAPAASAADRPRADLQTVSPDTFGVLRLPVLDGRAFLGTDSVESAKVAVVSRKAADRFWPGRNPLGALIRIAADATPLRIVGIVGDIELNWYDPETRPTIYIPDAQQPSRTTAVVMRTRVDPVTVAANVRGAVARLDSTLAIGGLEPLTTSIRDSLSPVRVVDRMLATGAAVSCLLAAVGVFGVLAHAVARCSREFGIRYALGATSRSIAAMVLRDALSTGGLGLICGLLLAAVGVRVVGSALFGLITVTPGIVAAVIVGTVLLVAGAAYAPAQRASRVDAAALLRQ